MTVLSVQASWPWGVQEERLAAHLHCAGGWGQGGASTRKDWESLLSFLQLRFVLFTRRKEKKKKKKKKSFVSFGGGPT